MMKDQSKKVNLLEKGAHFHPKNLIANDLVPYWYPDVTVNLVNFQDVLDVGELPPFTRKFIYADRIRKQYYPIIYFNEFWNWKETNPNSWWKGSWIAHQNFLSTTSDVVFPFDDSVWFCHKATGIHLWRTQWIWKHQANVPGNKSMVDCIDFPFVSFFIPFSIFSPLKTVPENIVIYTDNISFLDVQFWENKGYERIVCQRNTDQQLVPIHHFLYLLDSETSWIVLASVGVGALIELWKLTRVFEIRWTKAKYIPFLYIPSFHDRASYEIANPWIWYDCS